jgi:membrane fusion protein, heavy metal efflux system
MIRCELSTIRRAMRLTLVSGVLTLGIAACTPHTHDEAEPEHPSVVVTQWGDFTELFLEYPELIAGEATGNWAIHLTDMADFRPITAGRLQVRFLQGGAERQRFDLEAPARNGIFLLDPVVRTAGEYQVELRLESPQTTSVHLLPNVQVHASAAELPTTKAEEASADIAFLKEQQWVIDFAVAPAAEREVQVAVRVPAEVVPRDGGQVVVSAAVGGILRAELNPTLPALGQRVSRGDVLAVLAPTAEDNGYARLRETVERLEREVARAERLVAAGAIARKRLEEARHELAVAQAEAEAMGARPEDGFLHRIRAPISGVITARSMTPGTRVDVGAPLVTITDLQRLWLRVQLRDGDAARVGATPTAAFVPDGSPTRFAGARLVTLSGAVDSATRTVTALFALETADGALRLHQTGRAEVPLGERVRGLAIPADAILDEAGIPVAYVQIGGESFQRRRLRLGVSDGAWTQILEGIAPGEMVVVRGAPQVRLASLSTTPMSGGHAH